MNKLRSFFTYKIGDRKSDIRINQAVVWIGGFYLLALFKDKIEGSEEYRNSDGNGEISGIKAIDDYVNISY